MVHMNRSKPPDSLGAAGMSDGSLINHMRTRNERSELPGNRSTECSPCMLPTPNEKEGMRFDCAWR